jgi:Ca-activated chloride channel family protein
MLNKEDFNDDKKDAGEIGSGHIVTAIYEIVLADGESISSNVDPLNYQTSQVVKSDDLMTLKIRYKKPGQETSRLITSKVTSKDLAAKTNTNNFYMAVAVPNSECYFAIQNLKEHLLTSTFYYGQKEQKAKILRVQSGFISLVEKAKLLDKI